MNGRAARRGAVRARGARGAWLFKRASNVTDLCVRWILLLNLGYRAKETAFAQPQILSSRVLVLGYHAFSETAFTRPRFLAMHRVPCFQAIRIRSLAITLRRRRARYLETRYPLLVGGLSCEILSI